jgi:hypothetical protein
MSHAPRLAARALIALAALLLPATASATPGPPVRYAAVSGTGDACTSNAPCSLHVAIADAWKGDEVVVAPGTYRVDATLEPKDTVHIHGSAGQPRPWLVGSETLTDEVLSVRQGGSVRHLGIKALGPGGDAVTLQYGTAEDLLLVSEHGDGGKLVGAAGGTVLRDSVVHAGGAGASGLKLRDSGGTGDVHLVNVTLMAPAGSAVRCEMSSGQATLVNTIARGGTADVDSTKATAGHCTASTSSVRAARSPGLIDGGGNQEADPLFVDPKMGDYRVRDASPTDDAGASDPLLGATDPAGCPRTLGVAPDIGAYEHSDPIADACASVPAEPLLEAPALPPAPEPTPDPAPVTGGDVPTGGTDGTGAPAPVTPAPVLGHSVFTAPTSGTLRVRTPGSKRFRPLSAGTHVPVGSVVDARAGRVRLVSALDRAGHVQSASFWGSKFQIRQPGGARGRVDLYLRGGLAGCSAAASRAGATIAAARKRPRRSLWGKDRHGRYRTHGQSSAATARGTRWVTADTCAGTRTRVVEGAVAVRDYARHRTVIVRAGHSYLARKKRR